MESYANKSKFLEFSLLATFSWYGSPFKIMRRFPLSFRFESKKKKFNHNCFPESLIHTLCGNRCISKNNFSIHYFFILYKFPTHLSHVEIAYSFSFIRRPLWGNTELCEPRLAVINFKRISFSRLISVS